MADEINKIRLTKEGQQDRMVTESQLQPFLDMGFSQATADAPTSAPVVAPTDPEQLKAFNFAHNLPPPDSTFTTEKISDATPVAVPEVSQPGMIQAGATITGATTSLAEIMKTLAPPETETQVQEKTILDEMAALTGEKGQRGLDQLTAEGESPLSGLREQLSDINAQVLAKNAEFDTLKASYEQESQRLEASPATISRLKGKQAQNYKMYLAQRNTLAAEAGFLQAQAQGLQGKITDAQRIIDRSIDLKYASIQAELDTKIAQLQAIQPQLNREETLQARAQEILLNNQMRELEEKKEQDRQIQTMMLSAASEGAPSEMLSTISGAKTVTEASQVFSSFVRSQDVAGVSTGGGGTTTTTEKPLSTNQIEQFRRSYGWTPPFGFSQTQLLDYMADNPNATPEELEAGARQAQPTGDGTSTDTGGSGGLFVSADYLKSNFTTTELKKMSDKFGTSKMFRFATGDIDDFLSQVETKIQEARDADFSEEEILEILKP